MTYDSRERSADQARPVEFYTFSQDLRRWRYTSADRDITIGSLLFAAAAITRPEFEDSAERARAALVLTVPRNLPIADLYRVSPPTEPIGFALQQYHAGDEDLATLWTGRIMGVEFAGLQAQMRLEPSGIAVQRVGLRRLYQTQCPHVLYGQGEGRCNVNKAAFAVAGTIGSITGSTISVAAADVLADGWFSGGFVEYTGVGGSLERRFIESHAGAALSLLGIPHGAGAGDAVTIYPGCDHLPATCHTKFNNKPNFGGFEFLPQKNPFGGQPVF